VVGSDFLVPPVEPRLLPLVTRKSGVRDYQKRNDQNPSGHADSDRKRDREAEQQKRPRPDCLVSESKIDCKI
jgi:hypothetical protein